MRLTAAVALLLLSVAAQQPPPPPPSPQPPRDIVRQPADPTGTGVIRGRVVASDTGKPVRRASVSLAALPPPSSPVGTSNAGTAGSTPVSGVVGGVVGGVGGGMVATATLSPGGRGQVPPMITRPRQATTDAQGAFEFTGLPAGSYRLNASAGQYSPQYLGIAYGAKRANGPFSSDPGQPIQLANGQTFDKAVIALPRGAVIVGRVTDDTGDPLARVQVYVLFFPPGSTRGQRSNGAQTDDLGQFRLYGLQTGEYAVAAEAMRNTFVPPNAPPPTEEDSIGFMTTYYPGTADEGAAQRLRVRAGAETSGIEISLVQGRLYRVSGIVNDSQGRPLGRGNGQLTRRGASMGFSTLGFSTDEQGQFQMRNVPPGNYRLNVRQMRPGPQPPGAPNDPGEMASMPLTVAGDVENLIVVLTPGTTITGHVVFEQGPPIPMPKEIRVSAMNGNPDDAMGMPPPQAALVAPELTFTMKGLLGELLLRAFVQGQYLKSVTAGAEDITDTPREFKSNERVTITLTSRASTLEGSVTDAKGEPSTDAGIVMFAEDKALWRSNTSRTKRAGVDASGHFRVLGLMPGRYYIAAVPRDRLNAFSNPDAAAAFEQLSKEASTIVIGEDEQRRIDLKVTEGSGG